MPATPETVTAFARRLVEPNPGPMTLDGTNTWILQAPGAESVVVVDPGDLGHEEHLNALAALPVELILITHSHADHSDLAPELARRTGAPVRAWQASLSQDAEPLADGEILRAAGIALEVLHTPGHTADSLCFHLPEDGPHGSVLTGDTILGRGTTVLGPERGSLGDYLASLERLLTLGPATALTGHAAPLPSLEAVAGEYLAHRRARLDEVRAALDRLGPEAGAADIADVVYGEVDPRIRFAAMSSLRAQLEHLRDHG